MVQYFCFRLSPGRVELFHEKAFFLVSSDTVHKLEGAEYLVNSIPKTLGTNL